MSEWNDYFFRVSMPYMIPDKLSEVELLKHAGAFQWESIAKLLGVSPRDITGITIPSMLIDMVIVMEGIITIKRCANSRRDLGHRHILSKKRAVTIKKMIHGSTPPEVKPCPS